MAAPDFITAWLASGWMGVVLIALVEKLIPIVPSYALLIFLGMTIVSDPRDLTLTVAATTIGSACGSLLWYAVGRVIGAQRIEALVSRFGRYGFLKLSFYQRMTRTYLQNRFWVTLFGQLIPSVRSYLSLPAGVFGMALREFLAATVAGALIWNACLLTLGYSLRNGNHDPFSPGPMVIAGLILTELIIFIGLWAVARSRQK